VKNKGFTLMELLVAVVMISILAAIVLPTTNLTLERMKEMELKHNLMEIRTGLDAYKEGGYSKKSGENTPSGYPLNLNDLVKTHILRSIPRDPFNDTTSDDVNDMWKKVPFSTSDDSWYDIRSKSTGVALDGTKFNTW